MGEMIKLVISLSISGSVLALLLLAIKPLIKNKFSKSFQYYIWFIVLLRLALPISFETSLMSMAFSPTSNAEYSDQLKIIKSPATVNVEHMDTQINELTPKVIQSTQPQESWLNVQKLLLENMIILWLLGMLICLSFSFISYFRFIWYIKRTAIAAINEEMDILESLCSKFNIKTRIKLSHSQFVPTPMLVGIFHPQIILLDKKFSNEQLQNILMHELTHLKRHDIAIKWLTTIITAAHWFNPFVYFLRQEINRACELSCDELVIKNLDAGGKQSYGNTLISVVAESRYSTGVMSATMCEEKKTLKERLVFIMNYKGKSKSMVVLSVILLIFITGSALVLGASVTNNKKDVNPNDFVIESKKDINWNDFVIDMKKDKLLPSEILDTLPDFRTEKMEDGSILYIWSLYNTKEDLYIQNIQMTTLDNNLNFYHYKNYGFPYLERDVPLTKDEAGYVVLQFVREFVPSADGLAFENTYTYPSLYNPGHVEPWVAYDRSGNSYIVYVDLDMGGVIFFSVFSDSF